MSCNQYRTKYKIVELENTFRYVQECTLENLVMVILMMMSIYVLLEKSQIIQWMSFVMGYGKVLGNKCGGQKGEIRDYGRDPLGKVNDCQ